MAALNFKHLRYFWMVAKAGSVARASEQLHLTPQSVSGQIGEFESRLGVSLFKRVGRRLELTEAGERALRYAEEIFALGDELVDVLHDSAQHPVLPLRVGIADSVPKQVAYRLVAPALELDTPVRLICREGRLAALLAELSIHRLDLVIADRPMPGNLNVRGYSHPLGESALAVLGAPALADGAADFPQLLDDAPFLLPGEDVGVRASLLKWFESQRIRPRIVGEFDDSALMTAFARAGAGFFAVPEAVMRDVMEQTGARPVGRLPEVAEQLYAITAERRSTHPGIVAIRAAAASAGFGPARPIP
ncbi:transcriptional activator NhaR [Nitrogeniibacter mangrovi]|uniref:Transcriptional activator NhaR n=1 Tax=Nitrogeniibacter mangrovi TaxID=2016596 RepID=A0A6C1B1X9_9RHOO|nr:transcriptional activator NhaR [Nitrogeniibacter mangrovi]QID16828.1 transcriptional activator NhaR [Nitrogeniibacter mangrovi]